MHCNYSLEIIVGRLKSTLSDSFQTRHVP